VKKPHYKQPGLAADIIISIEDKIVLIKRKNPPYGWALPGGFVEYGETVENTARREAKEETGLKLVNLKQFKVYSEPNRDPRRHTISIVFTSQGRGEPKAADDACDIGLFSLHKLPRPIAFDHKKILKDFRRKAKT
jgi:ADP-ribose pyrophosphatase YjhB (NUDIX family)